MKFIKHLLRLFMIILINLMIINVYAEKKVIQMEESTLTNFFNSAFKICASTLSEDDI